MIVTDLIAGVDPGLPAEAEDNPESKPPPTDGSSPPATPAAALRAFFGQENISLDADAFRRAAERAATSDAPHAVQLVLERGPARVATAYVEESANGGWKMLDFAACYRLIAES
ncbi:MAG: hypothetical protein ACR2KQ_10855 [Actinomycetota bacterium]